MKKNAIINSKQKVKNSNSEEKSNGGVRALVRGLRILKCYDVEHQSYNIATLARVVGLHNATTRRLVKTLESESILKMDLDTGEYRLGSALLPTSYLVHSQDNLVRVARPFLERITATTEESVGLAVWIDSGILSIDGTVTPHFFKPPLTPGTVSTRYGSTHSKILLAFGPEERLSKMTFGERSSSMTLAELTNIHKELRKIRETGIAYDIEELTKGVCAVGVPVRDAVGEVIASIGVIIPTERFGDIKKEMTTSCAKEVGDALSRELGFRGH